MSTPVNPKWWRRLLCWLTGHDYSKPGAHPYGASCSRCGDRRTFIHDGCF